MGVAAALALWPPFGVGGLAGRLLAGAGALGVLTLAAGVALRRAGLVPAAALLLGAEYAVGLSLADAPLDPKAPLAAAALFVCCELGYWSLELAARVADEPGAGWRRLAWLSGTTILALALGAALVAAVDVARGGSLALEALGVAAAAAVLALAAVSARATRNER